MTVKRPPAEVSAPPGIHANDTYRAIVWRQFVRNRLAVLGLAVVLFLLAIAVLADFIANDKPLVMRYQGRTYFPIFAEYGNRLGLTRWEKQFQNIRFKDFSAANFQPGDWAWFVPIRYSPTETSLDEIMRKPSAIHVFGTDDVGRDVASRVVHGSRVSLSVGFVAVSIYVAIGVLIGAAAGYYGGLTDILASRLIEIMLTIPTLFLILTVVAFLPPSIFNIMVVIGLTNWPTIARLTRGEFLKLRSQEYVVAARAMGARDLRTIFRHILPNALAPIFVAATFGVASAVLVESTLSFLGLGVPPSAASWGAILYTGRTMLPSGWWMTAFPGLAIFLTVTSYNLVGEGVRDAADPRLKR
jgi:peptide/nickel transport system permease protein